MPSPLDALATLDVRDTIAPVDRHVFGSFVEHMGRCVYGGIYEPGHPTADADGFRGDVLELVRELGVTIVRYPGGNFASGYRWEDGVGPIDDRPVRLDLAWHSREPNAFGLAEFMRWTRAVNVEPMLTLNLGTRGVQETLDLLEYANHPGGTRLSDLRVAHGDREPYGIRTWCLGNELDGPWQLGHKKPLEYARLATETARAMRQFDSSLRLVAAGSSATTMPTFGDWERTVLEAAFELVDDISLHAYFEEGDDLASFLASSLVMDRSLDEVAAIADEVARRAGSERRVGLAVDEWNVWYLRRHLDRFHPAAWLEAPPISEDAYSVADAVVVGSLLISLLKHADRVTYACLAQLVNTIAPIKTSPGGPAWREATYYPFALTSLHARGEALRLRLSSPSLETEAHGDVPSLDGAAVIADDGCTVSMFLVNRHTERPVRLEVDLATSTCASIDAAVVLTDADVHATNSVNQPLRVRPRTLTQVVSERGSLTAVLPAVSWTTIRLRLG